MWRVTSRTRDQWDVALNAQGVFQFLPPALGPAPTLCSSVEIWICRSSRLHRLFAHGRAAAPSHFSYDVQRRPAYRLLSNERLCGKMPHPITATQPTPPCLTLAYLPHATQPNRYHPHKGWAIPTVRLDHNQAAEGVGSTPFLTAIATAVRKLWQCLR